LEEKQQQMSSEKPMEQPAPNECKLAVPDETGKEKTVEQQPKEGDGICLALGWREQLCRCGKCMVRQEIKCTFLTRILSLITLLPLSKKKEKGQSFLSKLRF